MSELKKTERRRHKEGRSKNERAAKKQLVLREIVDLDGDAQDYELIAGIDSDEDDEAHANKEKPVKNKSDPDASLSKELKRFAKELGFKPGKFIEEITVDDDHISEDGVEEQAVPADIAEREKAKKKERKRKDATVTQGQTDDADFKIHPKKAESLNNGGHEKGQPIFESTPLWHEVKLETLYGIPEEKPAAFIVNRQLEKAKSLLSAENELYSTSAYVKSSDRQFLSTIMRSGTLNDRVSALTLVVQESPIHATKSMDALMNMCKKKGRNEAVSAVGAVKDLMQGSILPERKLRYFSDQEAIGAKDVTDRHLIIWAFEDYLKRYYFELLGVMEALSMDPLPFPRNHMVRYIFELLKDKAEQEANLLRLLANKLGDKDKKIASKCSHFCLQLMQSHPMMTDIIVRELEQVLFRPTITQSAQYYVVITLNQTILSKRHEEVANHLINVYFTFFTKLINESEKTKSIPLGEDGKKNRKALKKEKLRELSETAEEEMNSKMISAVLTGVNRAFPFSNLEDNVIEKNIDTLYKITHSSNFNTSIQALILLHQVAVAKEATADRFYRTLYESVSDPRLLTSSKQALYLNLLFKSLKSDRNPERTKAFVKRLVQSATMHSPAFICALFFLFSELELAVPAIRQLATETKQEIRTTPKAEDQDKDQVQETPLSAETTYDGKTRDPRFANAGNTSLWEILPFLGHYHPSVSLFARSWLFKEQMPSKPDLSLHTLSHFLDRFVYRNAKTKANNHGGSIMQPLANGDTRGMILQQSGMNQQPVNSESFYKQNINKIAADEIFFYKYFNEKLSHQPEAGTAKKKKAEKRHVDSDGEGMDEEDVWQALVQSRPDVEAPDDSDADDLDLEDLDAAISGSDEDEDEDHSSTGLVDSNDDDDDEELGDGPVFDEADFEGEAEGDFPDFFEDEEDDLVSLPSDQDVPPTRKRKGSEGAEGDEKGKKKKKKVKGPAFASADEYLHLINQGEEDS